MVCAKCARLTGPTQLVTQTTKRATELPYGSASASKPGTTKTAGSSTLGHTGVSKVIPSSSAPSIRLSPREAQPDSLTEQAPQ